MDKSWMKTQITSKTFKDGVESFIDFARVKAIKGSIVCPCLKCCNDKWLDADIAHVHILRYGFLPGYTTWTFHGENCTPLPLPQVTSAQEMFHDGDNMERLVRDAFGVTSPPLNNEELRDYEVEGNIGVGNIAETGGVNPHSQQCDNTGENQCDNSGENNRYTKLLEECDKELYPGCKYSNLSFTLHLYQIKCIAGISNKGLGMLLELISDAFPHLTSLPSSVNEAKKLTQDLGLGYQKIDACPNDCMIYWGDRKAQQSCHRCKTSRYLGSEHGQSSKPHKSNKPAKVLRYFPLIPRLKRLYMNEKTAKDFRWHDMGQTKDGNLRHPADGAAWKAFDVRYPEFSSDSRSVRFGLSSDGFNPFRTMSTSHSTWPVILIPYNLPPWLCMKKESFILSMIIPGVKGPGNDIDVYLRPLIDELKLLWDGVDCYDAFSKQRFELRASLLWTISDFPAYANLSGWSTKGRVACPVCGKFTHSEWLTHGKKFCYMGHRRWLEPNDASRFQMDRFDGTIEERGPPPVLTGSEILKQISGTNFIYGKSNKSVWKRSIDDVDSSMHGSLHAMEDTCDGSCTFNDTNDFIEENINAEQKLWKKRSIFFDLPYWEYNLLRHNLDVMHIEKNVCDNLLGTLLNIDGKSKDNENTRIGLVKSL